MYATGNHTDRMIATWLNQTEHKPRTRRRDSSEREYVWTRDSVKALLKNAFYLGMVKYKDEYLPGKHSSIITQELFDAAKRMRKEHYIGPSTHAANFGPICSKGFYAAFNVAGRYGHSISMDTNITGKKTRHEVSIAPTARLIIRSKSSMTKCPG